MRLFGRIFLGHLLTVVIACLAFAAAIWVISPEFYRQQLDSIFLLVTPQQASLRVRLEEGQQRVMLMSLLASLPVSVLLALGTAYLETRRVTAVVGRLAEGSREIAEGRYGRRLEVRSDDELGAIALHFNRMAEALEEADRSRAQMVGVVAHEIRTPLSNLRNHAEALSDEVLRPEEAVSTILREVSILQRITNDLLMVARVEARDVKLQLVPNAPQELVTDAHERFVHAFEDESVTLELEVAGTLPVVCADRERVGQVLGNLLSNAFRYTPPGGRVTMGAQLQGEFVQFSIADGGPGISTEHLPHLFERFYRVDPESSRSDRHLGVGLTVAKGLVEAMGGNIWVESELGRGSTFFFTLPKVA